MDAEIRKWGNSYAIRLPKAELDRLGLHEGDRVEVDLKKAPRRRAQKISLAGMPIAHDTVADVSARHDAYLYGGKP
jgi:antitoxin component of MazEF toxin-antitoxin module